MLGPHGGMQSAARVLVATWTSHAGPLPAARHPARSSTLSWTTSLPAPATMCASLWWRPWRPWASAAGDW